MNQVQTDHLGVLFQNTTAGQMTPQYVDVAAAAMIRAAPVCSPPQVSDHLLHLTRFDERFHSVGFVLAREEWKHSTVEPCANFRVKSAQVPRPCTGRPLSRKFGGDRDLKNPRSALQIYARAQARQQSTSSSAIAGSSKPNG